MSVCCLFLYLSLSMKCLNNISRSIFKFYRTTLRLMWPFCTIKNHFADRKVKLLTYMMENYMSNVFLSAIFEQTWKNLKSKSFYVVTSSLAKPLIESCFPEISQFVQLKKTTNFLLVKTGSLPVKKAIITNIRYLKICRLGIRCLVVWSHELVFRVLKFKSPLTFFSRQKIDQKKSVTTTSRLFWTL